MEDESESFSTPNGIKNKKFVCHDDLCFLERSDNTENILRHFFEDFIGSIVH